MDNRTNVLPACVASLAISPAGSAYEPLTIRADLDVDNTLLCRFAISAPE